MNKKQVIRINESQLRQIVTESVKRVLVENAEKDYTNDIDFTPLIQAAKHASQNPMHTYDVIVNGFKFGVTFVDSTDLVKGYRATICIGPNVLSKDHCYGKTIEDFINSANLKIKELMKYFTDGGRYPVNYHTNFSN